MPPAARALPPSGLLSGGIIPPGPPQRRRIPHRLAPARDTAVLWASDILFQDAATEPPGNCFSKKGVSECPSLGPPRLQKSWEGEGWGLGKGEGSFSSEKFPLPSPSFRYLLNTLPMPRMPASSKSLPMSCIPTGRPSASPTGNERPGSPARFRDTV